jgi:hypothetical protein
MKTYAPFLIVGLSIFCFSSCSNEVDDTSENIVIDSSLFAKPDTIGIDSSIQAESDTPKWNFNQADERIISISDRVDMGASYKAIQSVLPEFKGVRAENRSAELADKGFVEGICETQLFGRKAKGVFHFKNDSLYSYDVSVPIIDMKEAERKYNEIKAYYTNKYGEPNTPRVEEDNYTSTTSYWKTSKGYVVLTNDLSNAEIQFGIQNVIPK